MLSAGHQFELHRCTAALNLLRAIAGYGNPHRDGKQRQHQYQLE
jgi:hypothetical protein